MSDFLIDFREKGNRSTLNDINLMKYYDDIKVEVFEYEKFTLFLSRSDDWNLWGPYSSTDGEVFIAISGRIAMENWEWEKAKSIEGNGGVACKAIYKMYKSEGLKSLEKMNGNFVVLVFDAKVEKLYIIIDRCGMVPAFVGEHNNNKLVFSSHPDVLAKAIGNCVDWDITSMGEFIITGKISFPYSYYKKINALDYGCIHTIDLKERKTTYESEKKYFDFNFKIDPSATEWDLAEELAKAFRKAVNRRTFPIFGQTAVSLSGGLDARTILCSADNKNEIWTFCFFDEENLEYRIAKDIARETGVKFIPLKRGPHYYSNNTEMGVKISGGMGSIMCNHYLGARDSLIQLGISNVISGFYCDYLFKGLEMNKKINKILRTETLTKFEYKYYEPIFWTNTFYAKNVRERLDQVFPEEMRKDESDVGRLRIEQRRIFPLYFDSENPETTIPQRVIGWYLPTVDNDIIDIYLQTPPSYKLNLSMYSKMVSIQCGEKLSKIINVNTGAKVNASKITLAFCLYKKALEKRMKRLKRTFDSDDSWPNWQNYIHKNPTIKSIWMRRNIIATDIFRQILGKDPDKMAIQEYRGPQVRLFFRMLTLKLWLEQRM